MLPVLLAIAPVFLLILLGYLLASSNFLQRYFWEGAERLTYFILFPALLFLTLARADLRAFDVWPMAFAMSGAVAAMTLFLLIVRPALSFSGAAFTSLFQGSIRFNTYIGLAVTFGLYGTKGMAPAALAVACVVPLTNVLSVLTLASQGSSAQPRPFAAVGAIIKNPLILACTLGIAVNLGGFSLPPVGGPLLDILARGALPLGLLAVGAGLEFGVLTAGGAALILACLLKLAILPILTALGCWIFEVSGLPAVIAVLFNGLPAAPSAYILARQLGGDSRLMAGIITAQVALSALSLPLLLSLLKG